MGSSGTFPPVSGFDSSILFKVALLLSLTLHLLFLAGPALLRVPAPAAQAAHAVKVALVHRPNLQPPPPDTLLDAQADSHAGGDAKPAARAAAPDRTAITPAPAEERATAAARTPHLVRQHAESAAPAVAAPRLSADSLLAQARELVAKPQGEVDERFSAHDAAPVRGVFGVNARGVEWARYVEDWRLKVERVGRLNYPDAARRQGLFGSLQLNVVLGADGRLLSVAISRSSGHPLLDEAALRIVRMAAPFPPFPSALAAQFSSLQIARKWSFTSENELFSR